MAIAIAGVRRKENTVPVVSIGYDASDAILPERKDMRRRGLASPDDGDALALTFVYPVARRDWAEERRFDEGLQKLKRWVV